MGLVKTGRLDSRHLGAALIGAAACASGPLVAGASLLFCCVAGLVGIVLFGGRGLRVVPEWRDAMWGPWSGGALFSTLAAVDVVIALALRH